MAPNDFDSMMPLWDSVLEPGADEGLDDEEVDDDREDEADAQASDDAVF